jgi:hypothetical protein
MELNNYLTLAREFGEGEGISHPLLKRDKVSLDLFWMCDESLEGADTLPSPDVLAASIVEDLQTAFNILSKTPCSKFKVSVFSTMHSPRLSAILRVSAGGAFLLPPRHFFLQVRDGRKTSLIGSWR